MLIGFVQVYLFLGLALVAFGVELWALVHAARQPAPAFVSAGKRTKNFWLLLLGAGAALGFIAIPPPLGVGIFGGFLQFFFIVPAAIYLADVKPAVSGYRRRPPNRGGW
ncbi:DUF2516 family protein [Georgenia faecalis]|uniref:DUF2516 family protein n=1 Tax=Georgenia faecalis TaxID=2483799 RepID=A0ABV9DEF5_9MICO|nr:DUF2516 family protein [Georgenia faecalis]